jgi:uncharacterized coiled-coil DUF342 family protein
MSENTTQELAFQATTGDFAALEQKVYKLIQLLKETREGRLLAELELEQVREQLETRDAELASLKGEVDGLRSEREEIKGRVDKILSSVDQIISTAE